MSNLRNRVKRIEEQLGEVNRCNQCGDGRWGRTEIRVPRIPKPPHNPHGICDENGFCKTCGRYVELFVIEVRSPGYPLLDDAQSPKASGV